MRMIEDRERRKNNVWNEKEDKIVKRKNF